VTLIPALFYSKRAPSWNLERITGGVAATFGLPAMGGRFVPDFLQQQHFAYSEQNDFGDCQRLVRSTIARNAFSRFNFLTFTTSYFL
jgi:hypothetical protein